MEDDKLSWHSQNFRLNAMSKIMEAMDQSVTIQQGLELERRIFERSSSKDQYMSHVGRIILLVKDTRSKASTPGTNPTTDRTSPDLSVSENNQILANRDQAELLSLNSVSPHQAFRTLNLITRLNNMAQNVQSLPTQTLDAHNTRPRETANAGTESRGSPTENQFLSTLRTSPVPLRVAIPSSSSRLGTSPITSPLTVATPPLQLRTSPIAFPLTAATPSSSSHRRTSPVASPSTVAPPSSSPHLRTSPIYSPPSASHPRTSPIGSPSTVAPISPSPQLRTSPVASPSTVATSSSSFRLRTSHAASPLLSGMTTLSGNFSNVGQSYRNHPMSQNEQAYREKLRQLSKYIDPLRKMMASTSSEDKSKLCKMRKLLEILSTPHQCTPLETLLKCESVLKRLNLKHTDSNDQTSNRNNKECDVDICCPICMEGIRSYLFVQCRHLAACRSCISHYKVVGSPIQNKESTCCPICRTPILCQPIEVIYS